MLAIGTLLYSVAMVDVATLLHGVVLLSGVLGALGTGYLLYSDAIIVHYTGFFKIITAGLLLFAVTAPIIVEFAPESIHAIHALSALFISIGLYTLVRQELEPDDDFERLGADVTTDTDE